MSIVTISESKLGSRVKRKPRLFVEADAPLEADTVLKSPYFRASYHYPYNPDTLVPGNDYSIYDEMRDDDQVKAVLSLKKDMNVNTGWRVVSDDQEVQEFLEGALNRIGSYDGMEDSFEDVLRGMLTSYDYGFSIADAVFIEPGDSVSGKYEIRLIKVRPPHSFLFHLDDVGIVREIEQRTSNGAILLEPSRIIHHVYQPDFSNPYGKSDLKAAHTPWKSKKFILRMAMRYSERFAGALVIGRYDPNMEPAEVSRFQAVLKSIQDNTVLTVPSNTQIELAQPAKDSTDHYIKLLNHLNTWIARAVLVPDLLGISGDKTGGGSYSLGVEQFKVFLASIEKDRLSLARKITNHLIKPLVNVNFGDKVTASFEFKPFSREDQSQFLALWSEAVRGGAWKASEDEIRHFLRKTGFPEPETIQLVLEPVAPEKSPALPKEQAEEKAFARSRPSYEKKMDFARLEGKMDRADGSLLRDAQSIVRKQLADLLSQMKDKAIINKFAPAKVESLRVKYQKELNDVFRSHFKAMFWDALEGAKNELFPDGIRSFVADDLTPDDYEDLMIAESFKLVGDITSDILKRTKNRIFSGMKAGLGEAEIAKQIRDEVDDKITNALLRTVVRTRTTEFFNAARQSYFQDDPMAAQIITGYQWSAILDTRTSEICERLDGMKFGNEKDADFLARVSPPTHFNCRSILVPITKFEVKDQEDFDTPPKISTLQALGGNLIFQLQPNLVASGEASTFGGTPVIAKPGPGKRLLCKVIQAANLSETEPVIVGFRDGLGDAKYRTNLAPRGGSMTQDLRPDGWLLSEDTELSIDLSSAVRVSYTVDYEVIAGEGIRVA